MLMEALLSCSTTMLHCSLSLHSAIFRELSSMNIFDIMVVTTNLSNFPSGVSGKELPLFNLINLCQNCCLICWHSSEGGLPSLTRGCSLLTLAFPVASVTPQGVSPELLEHLGAVC